MVNEKDSKRPNISQLIDFEKVDSLLEGFNKSTGFVTAILDLEGNILSKSGWRPICTEFHRVHPVTSNNCRVSDTVLANKMGEGSKYHFYKCLNGLVDVAVPIIINGEHVANLFSGQFFFEEPDKEFFIKQAQKYGFDETKYLNSLSQVPISSSEKAKAAMDFLHQMTQFIAEQAYQKNKLSELTKELWGSEERLRLATEQSKVAVWEYDFISNSMERSFNHDKLYGLEWQQKWDINTFLNATHPDDREYSNNYIMKSVTPNGPDSYSFDFRVIFPDNSIRWLFVNGQVIERDELGQGIRVRGVLFDITERKQVEEALRESEDKFRALIQASSNVVYRMNADWTEMYHLDGRNFLADTNVTNKLWLQNYIYPDDQNYVMSKINESIRTKSFFELEHRVFRLDGSLGWTFSRAIPILDESGDIKEWFGMASDITDNKLSELELEKYRHHLEELIETRTAEINRINKDLQKEVKEKNDAHRLLKEALEKEKELSDLRSRFISTASHEFRTPLTSILMSTGLIQRYYKNWDQGKTDEHFERVIHSVKSLTNIIDEVITLNRADSGKLKLSPQKTDLEDLCKRKIDEIENATHNKCEIKLSYECTNKYYILDPKQIDVILQNLLSNAVKYSPEGIDIKVKATEEEAKIILMVTDAGIGIPEEDLPKLFEPFHRARNADDFQGSGLGLSIVKNAIKLHGGEIKVVSELGKGTKFTVQIPITTD